MELLWLFLQGSCCLHVVFEADDVDCSAFLIFRHNPIALAIVVLHSLWWALISCLDSEAYVSADTEPLLALLLGENFKDLCQGFKANVDLVVVVDRGLQLISLNNYTILDKGWTNIHDTLGFAFLSFEE